MAQYDGSIRINTQINTDGLKKGEADIKSSMGRVSAAAKKFAAVIGAAFAVGKIVQFGKECLDLGSDLQEVQNVVDVTFTTMSKKVNEFAKNSVASAGLSETMAKRYVGTFGAMAKSFGFAEEDAYNMSTALAQLSGDVASFYNISQDEAYTKLKSVFTGETETLKDLGVVMTQSALDAYAMANGIGKSTSAVSEQEKVALRYRFVLDQLSAASGDFMRTSGGWANQVRILKLQFDGLKATIGQGLINVFTPVIKVINVVLAKLATLANAFKAFTELITGNKSQSGGSTGLSQDDGEAIGAGYNEAAEGAENLAGANEDAAKSASKAAKAAKGQLSTLDKLNNLSSDSSGGGGGAGGGGAGGGMAGAVEAVDYGKLAEGENEFEKLGGILNSVIAKAKELAGLFKTGFFEGLGDYEPRLSGIKTDIESIGQSLKNIFTDPEVTSSANNFADQLVYSLGQVTGSVASIGLTIAQNLIGGMESYLAQNAERIRGYIVDMFDIGSDISSIVGNFSVAFSDIFSVFGGETAQQITGNLIGIFAEVGMLVSETAAKLGRDILNMITQPIIDNKEKIKTAIENTLQAIEPFTSGLLTAVQTVSDAVSTVYDEHLKPLFDSAADGASEILGVFLDGYNNILVPILSWISKNAIPILSPIVKFIGSAAIKPLRLIIDTIANVSDILRGLIDFISGAFTGNWKKSWNGIRTIFRGIFSGIDTWLGNKFGSAYAKVKSAFSASGAKQYFSSVWSNIKGVFGNVAEWFRTKFSVAWTAVKNVFSKGGKIFSGIKDGILSGLRVVINGLITGINKVISVPFNGLNTALRKLKSVEIAGISPFSSLPTISVPQIPKLATGAVIPANKEFMAVLGDQKHGRNLEAPEGLMRKIVSEETAKNASGGEITIKIPVEIEGRVLFEIIKKLDLEQYRRTGRPSFQI